MNEKHYTTLPVCFSDGKWVINDELSLKGVDGTGVFERGNTTEPLRVFRFAYNQKHYEFNGAPCGYTEKKFRERVEKADSENVNVILSQYRDYVHPDCPKTIITFEDKIRLFFDDIHQIARDFDKYEYNLPLEDAMAYEKRDKSLKDFILRNADRVQAFIDSNNAKLLENYHESLGRGPSL